jgi:hypothetical protein
MGVNRSKSVHFILLPLTSSPIFAGKIRLSEMGDLVFIKWLLISSLSKIKCD